MTHVGNGDEQQDDDSRASASCRECALLADQHQGSKTLTEISTFLGFDVARAARILAERLHRAQAHESQRSPEHLKALRRAYNLVWMTFARSSGPERVALAKWVAVIGELRRGLSVFVEAAQGRKALESKRYLDTPRPRIPDVTGQSLVLAKALDRYLRWLESKWAFDGADRTLPGTRRTPGQKSKQALAEVEHVLRRGGFKMGAIAELDLDGLGPKGAKDRVKKRARRPKKLGWPAPGRGPGA